MHSMKFLLLAGVALFATPVFAQTPADGPAAIIAAAKQASGGAAWDHLTTTHDHGTATAGGLSGTFQDWLDWPHMLTAGSYALGPATGKQGWDGKAAWSVDSSGQVRVERSAEAVANAVEQAYLSTYALYFPGRYPAKIDSGGTRVDAGATYQVVNITPNHANPVAVWFDATTHLPVRVVELSGAQPHSLLMSDFRVVDGVKLPFHVITRVGNDPRYDQVTQMVALTNANVPASTFAPPPPPPYDADFPSGKTSVTVPIRVLNNHIYLDVSINGRPAVPFIFDTGATNFLDSGHAKILGVKPEGALPGGGFGSKISSVGLARVGSVSVGGLTLHNQVFATNDLVGLFKVEGVDAAGLIGYEFAKRTVVTIDYAQHKMTFTKPDAFTPPAGVTPVAFTFDAHIPMVQATIDGIPGQFEIDTGSRGALTLMHPFAAGHGLIAKYHATTLATTGYGVGGPSKSLLARGQQLVIGPVTLDQPLLELVNDAQGAAAETHTAGNIGGDILKRFTLTLDYAKHNLYFQPNALASKPEVFDRSGLWVNRGDDGMITIADVTPNSAGDAADLKHGDQIIAVNDHDSRVVELYGLRKMFQDKPGTIVHLTVKTTDGKTRHVSLKLANQI
jgi:hypothetical protein